MRYHEFEDVLRSYTADMGLNVIGVDAKEHFYRALEDVTDPEQKRKIIGKGFIDIFDREAKKLKDIKWLAQGTIYPDVIESLSITGMTIKSHHNVGGLPEKMSLNLVEPLRLLFKTTSTYRGCATTACMTRYGKPARYCCLYAP